MKLSTEIRKASRSDAERVKQLEVSSSLESWPLIDYVNEAERSSSVFLVAVDLQTKRVVGFLIMRLITINKDADKPLDERGGEGEILNIAVDEKFRRNGVAGRMLLRALAEGVDQGIETVFLEVRSSNEAAIGFYKGFGFEVFGIRQGFYSRPREDAVLMGCRPDKTLARIQRNGLVFEL